MSSGAGERLYRRLLRLLPAAFRAEAEPDLLEVFQAGYRRALTGGRLARGRFWLRMLADVVVTALAERGARGHRRPREVNRSDRMNVTRLLSSVAADTRFAARHLARTPGWTAIASGTLALGLAASVMAAVLMRDIVLRPLTLPEPDRLVRVLEISQNGRGWWPSFPNARDWRDHGRMFDGVAIGGTPRIEPVLLDTSAVRVQVAKAGAQFFEILGVQPQQGRLFAADENRPGGPAVTLVTERFWRGALNGQPLGNLTVGVGPVRYQVIGVIPASFKFLGEAAAWTTPADVWLPLERELALGRRTSHGEYHVVARLRRGIDLTQARREANELATTLKALHREPTQADALLLTPLQEVAVRSAREPLRLLVLAGLAVLLVAALNLAAAVLAQGLTRAGELHIRLALGATRWRLAQHVLIGAATLAVPGAVGGLLLAAVGLRGIKAAAAGTWPRLDEVALDWRSAALGFAAAAVTAGVAGVLPALLLSARAARERLRTHGATGTARGPRVWTGFVGAQVAITVLLLCVTGLLVRSFAAATQVDLGYDPRGVLDAAVTLPAGSYEDPPRRTAYFEAALERLRGLPEVEAAGISSHLPTDTTAYTSGTRRDVPDAKFVMGGYRLVDRGYFDVIRVPLLQGDARAFDNGGALIDRRLQELLWAGSRPAGEHVLNGFAYAPLPVHGVVGTIREWNQGDDTIGVVYADYRRQPQRTLSMHLMVRYRGDVAAAAAAVRRTLSSLDPMAPVDVRPLESEVAAALGARRLLLMIAVGFGAGALLLASAGVYAMIAFAVDRQRRESAIRLALGARPSALQRRVVRQGLAPALAGVAIGLSLMVPFGAIIRAQLFEVTPGDPVVLAAAAVAMLAAALVASLVPAHRSSRVDPAVALRQE